MKQQDLAKSKEYKYGFTTDIESVRAPKGLNKEVIRFISKIKKEPEWMLSWRLKAYSRLKNIKEPNWQKPKYPKIDYQDLYYYSAPKSAKDKPKSLDEVDPKLLETYAKLGISLKEQEKLSGVAVDAIFDSVSVATTFIDTLTEKGIIFCSISIACSDGLKFEELSPELSCSLTYPEIVMLGRNSLIDSLFSSFEARILALSAFNLGLFK